MVCGFGEAISYVNLVKRVTRKHLDKISRFTDWCRRPLSRQAARLCARRRDAPARDLRAPEERTSRRPSARTGSTRRWRRSPIRRPTIRSPRTPGSGSRCGREKPQGLAVLMELAAWRERQAQAQDVPRSRILRDEALYDIANQAPTEVAAARAAAHSVGRLFPLGARARDHRCGEARRWRATPRPCRPCIPARTASAEASARWICCACC